MDHIAGTQIRYIKFLLSHSVYNFPFFCKRQNTLGLGQKAVYPTYMKTLNLQKEFQIGSQWAFWCATLPFAQISLISMPRFHAHLLKLYGIWNWKVHYVYCQLHLVTVKICGLKRANCKCVCLCMYIQETIYKHLCNQFQIQPKYCYGNRRCKHLRSNTNKTQLWHKGPSGSPLGLTKRQERALLCQWQHPKPCHLMK